MPIFTCTIMCQILQITVKQDLTFRINHFTLKLNSNYSNFNDSCHFPPPDSQNDNHFAPNIQFNLQKRSIRWKVLRALRRWTTYFPNPTRNSLLSGLSPLFVYRLPLAQLHESYIIRGCLSDLRFFSCPGVESDARSGAMVLSLSLLAHHCCLVENDFSR